MRRPKGATRNHNAPAPYLYSQEMSFLPIIMNDKENSSMRDVHSHKPSSKDKEETNNMSVCPSPKPSSQHPLRDISNLSRISEKTEPSSEVSFHQQSTISPSVVSCHKH